MNDANPQEAAMPVPPQMAIQPPIFGARPTQKKPKAKGQTPNFLPAETESATAPTKTLLGQ